MVMCMLAVVAQMALPGGRSGDRDPAGPDDRRSPEASGLAPRRLPFGKTFATFVLAPICVLMAFPFVWLLLTSLRPQNTMFYGPFFPRSITGAAYPKAWTSIEFPLHFWNSLWITSVTVVGVLVFATLSGYAFAKLDFPFSNTLYLLLADNADDAVDGADHPALSAAEEPRPARQPDRVCWCSTSPGRRRSRCSSCGRSSRPCRTS